MLNHTKHITSNIALNLLKKIQRGNIAILIPENRKQSVKESKYLATVIEEGLMFS